MIGTVLTFLAVGLITLLVAGVVLSIIGAALGLAGFLLFKVAPILLVGWIVMKVIDRKRQGSLSAEDRRWLEGD